jgi:hypothetical protein
MRVKRVIPVIVAAAALAIPAAASAAGNTVCDHNIGSVALNSNVTVPAGTTCSLSGSINGNVTVNGELKMFGGHVTGNVTVNRGGSFSGINWPVTIDKNLTITDPAANSASGFWGDYSYDETGHIVSRPDLHLNVVKGNITYTITPEAAAAYPDYQWPSLYFGGGAKVNGSYNYSVGSLSSVRPMPVL